MTVQEARAVRWLRNNPRPLGELLDEGYLDQGRLEWAAQKAYDPRLRAAAAVLLETLRSASARLAAAETPPAVNAGITIEQARATRWPFQPFRNQPMGALVDAQQIGRQDLGYAIEHARDERVRRAAIALMAIRLNQVVQEPPPAAGPLQVLAGGPSYAERQQLRLRMIQGVILGGLLGVLLTVLVFVLAQLSWGTGSPPGESLSKLLSTPTGVVALIVAVVILLALSAGGLLLSNFLTNLFMRKFDEQVAAYRKGQEGEERTVEVLRRNLDGNWTLFRNVTLPGPRNDIDLVLVGPPGVWALEVKNLASPAQPTVSPIGGTGRGAGAVPGRILMRIDLARSVFTTTEVEFIIAQFEQAEMAVQLLARFGAAPQTRRIEICSGYVNQPLRERLRRMGYDVRVVGIRGLLAEVSTFHYLCTLTT